MFHDMGNVSLIVPARLHRKQTALTLVAWLFKMTLVPQAGFRSSLLWLDTGG